MQETRRKWKNETDRECQAHIYNRGGHGEKMESTVKLVLVIVSALCFFKVRQNQITRKPLTSRDGQPSLNMKFYVLCP